MRKLWMKRDLLTAEIELMLHRMHEKEWITLHNDIRADLKYLNKELVETRKAIAHERMCKKRHGY